MGNHSKYPNVAGIYKITCVNNGKVYIGKANNLRVRINNHKNCRRKTKGMFHFQYALLKHGWDSFTVEILETVDNFNKLTDNPTLLEREAYYIELFDSTNTDKGYNRCKHSTDNTGRPLSDEHKEKLRQAKLGKKCSDEHKERIRQANIGKTYSEEVREKKRQSMLGKVCSEETKEKMRQSSLGRKMPEEIKEKIRQTKLRKKLEEHNQT